MKYKSFLQLVFIVAGASTLAHAQDINCDDVRAARKDFAQHEASGQREHAEWTRKQLDLKASARGNPNLIVKFTDVEAAQNVGMAPMRIVDTAIGSAIPDLRGRDLKTAMVHLQLKLDKLKYEAEGVVRELNENPPSRWRWPGSETPSQTIERAKAGQAEYRLSIAKLEQEIGKLGQSRLRNVCPDAVAVRTVDENLLNGGKKSDDGHTGTHSNADLL